MAAVNYRKTIQQNRHYNFLVKWENDGVERVFRSQADKKVCSEANLPVMPHVKFKKSNQNCCTAKGRGELQNEEIS